MSVARLKKLSLVGLAGDKTVTLSRLQALGVMHLISLAPPHARPDDELDRHPKDAYAALRFLSVVPHPRRQLRQAGEFDAGALIADVLKLKENLRALRDKRAFLIKQIDKVTPWGEFKRPPEAMLAGQNLWFYALPIKQRASLKVVTLPWAIVAEDATCLYVVLIAEDPPSDDVLPVRRLDIGDQPLSELEAALDDTENEIEAIQAERMALTRFLDLLRADISQVETAAELAFANGRAWQDEALFALQGWVPEDRITEVESLGADLGLAMLIEAPGPQDKPPTLLQHPQKDAAGVDLAMFYQTPGYYGWDPTVLLVLSFALFFAMIVADAGYGAVLCLLLGLFWRRLSRSAHLRSWRRLCGIIAGATLGYGVIVGSYFGASPGDGTLLAHLAVLNLNDFDTMMKLSIILGVVHISVANFMAFASKPGRIGRANLGWIALLLGGLLAWLNGFAGPARAVGFSMGAIGIICVIYYASEREITRPLDWAWRLFDGIKNLFGAMGMFGDVLSYMRLFALGLASASLALTFNGLAWDVMASHSGLAILGGVLILLVGHLLNFALAVMSGVVHGLRLNYIEFYKWGLPEEGVAFRTFCRKEIQE